MTIRIHEADGTPYEHVLDIRQPFKRFEVPFNTKYKRVRRNTKRYMARQAAAQAAVDGEEPPTTGPVPGELVDVGFAVEIWDNERERDNWKISEWSEEDDARMASATYEWIRLDVDLEWITAIAFEQPDYMWVSQLQRDRDVVAQLEAIQALKRQPTAIISSVLVKTVLVSKYFHRIRCEAALALASVSQNRCFEGALLNDSYSAQSRSWTTWDCFICSSFSCGIASNPKIRVKIFSLIHMYPAPMTSLIWLNTLYAR